MTISFQSEGTRVILPGFSLADTLECGQCFRWRMLQPNCYEGIANGRRLIISQQGEELLFKDVGPNEFPFWRDYFDLDTDYSAFIENFCTDETLRLACRAAGGIRILRQEPWEALCSFIISQNNNIPRIKAIADRLCVQFGQPIAGGFAFPTPERLASETPETLAPLKAGFRAKYILDAARKVTSGEVPLQKLAAMPLDEARRLLMSICGVGPKVAECALLYGCHRLDAFPVDTWIKKVLAQYYPEGFPDVITPRGVAQQFLFFFIRTAK